MLLERVVKQGTLSEAQSQASLSLFSSLCHSVAGLVTEGGWEHAFRFHAREN